MSGLLLRNLPSVLPIALSKVRFHRCNGRLGRRTHIGTKEMIAVVGSKDGNQGVRKSPELPQNHIPDSTMTFMSSALENSTMKNPRHRGK